MMVHRHQEGQGTNVDLLTTQKDVTPLAHPVAGEEETEDAPAARKRGRPRKDTSAQT